MNQPTPEQIARLPKWAQEHINTLRRERKVAVQALQKYTDNQTPSNVWTTDMFCTGQAVKGPTHYRNYFQANRLEIESAGVHLDIDALYDNREIRLSWRPAGEGIPMGDVLFIPSAYQQAKLVALENGR